MLVTAEFLSCRVNVSKCLKGPDLGNEVNHMSTYITGDSVIGRCSKAIACTAHVSMVVMWDCRHRTDHKHAYMTDAYMVALRPS